MVGFWLSSEAVRDGDSERGKGAAMRAVAGRAGGWSARREADPDVCVVAARVAALECRNATMGIREDQVDVGIFLTSEVLSRPGIVGTVGPQGWWGRKHRVWARGLQREIPDSGW